MTDVLTAAAISWYLRKLRTGYQRSDTLVNKLVIYAVSRDTVQVTQHLTWGLCFQINTGLLTSAFSVACLITYGTMSNTFIFIGLYFVLSKRELFSTMPAKFQLIAL